MEASRILITASPKDAHTRAIRWGLSEFGINSDCFFTGDFPQFNKITVRPNTRSFEIKGPNLAKRGLENYSVVWNRRLSTAYPHESIQKEDHLYVEQSSSVLFSSIFHHLEKNALCINPFSAAKTASNKVLQLEVAQKIGLQIPRTIITNDASEARDFLSGNGNFIVKSLVPMVWNTESSMSVLPTTAISKIDIEDDIAVESCPMIYQEMVDKKWEYRVTVFDGKIFTAKISAHSTTDSRIKFWNGKGGNLPVEKTTLPEEIHSKIIEIMKAFNLWYCVFDLALSTAGEIIFFEINQQGQFLWLEDLNPEFLLLNEFVASLQKILSVPNKRKTEKLTLSNYVKAIAFGSHYDETNRNTNALRDNSPVEFD